MSDLQSRARAFAALAAFAALGCVHPPAAGVTYLDQGWSDADRRFFYHTTQGTRLIPWAWFQALEQPHRAAPFTASDYVERYRFLPDPDPRGNPDRLPVGFAKDVDPETRETYLGFTCATCHTGQITHRGVTLRVDGGAAPIDIVGFTDAVFGALAATLADPERFSRFARAVLQDRCGEDSARALREQIQRTLEFARARSLHGIWATAPYLHNGSVPNLYELLLPADQRSRRFSVGNSELDPRRVGFRVEPSPGTFELVTDSVGNSNAGHELRDGPAGAGVLGPAMGEEDRWDLIEYLKTL